LKPIRNVVIYGYGVMGRGVAKTFALGGYNTSVKTRRAISTTELPAGVVASQMLPRQAPDLIVELVSEDAAIKRAVFAEIEAAYPAGDVIIATGTSGLDLVELADGLNRPQNFAALHYVMPADITLVVEVVAGPATSREVVDSLAQVMIQTGKEPVRLYKPVVGFVLNRLQHALLHEAYYLVENGIASVADIDHVIKRALAPRMCINGLILQKDISGLRVHAEAQRSIVPALYHNGVPNPLVQAMAARGETGLGAGKGFYDWSGCDAGAVRAQTSAQLQELMGFIDRGLSRSFAHTQPQPRDLSGLKVKE
jgi:3-hydroxybutyryl-CoA dehydrogenase